MVAADLLHHGCLVLCLESGDLGGEPARGIRPEVSATISRSGFLDFVQVRPSPCYRRFQLIEQTLPSVTVQNFPNLDVHACHVTRHTTLNRTASRIQA